MIICRTKAEMREAVRGWKRAGETVGVVPTMGYLHEAISASCAWRGKRQTAWLPPFSSTPPSLAPMRICRLSA